MDCQNCGEHPAVIHLTQIVNNSVTTLHLCDSCAEEKGVQTASTATKFPLSDFLASMGKGASAHLQVTDEKTGCTACGATLGDFRDTGRLGCPQCYDSFHNHLKDLLRKLHGSSKHVGERYEVDVVPVETESTGGVEEDLRAQLEEAIQAEQFELAAQLRDRIKEGEPDA
jgi:protein arginine kinase activator